ncbi:MAG: hypothetical protein CVU72_00900 [Deltaproteobacteria bacterium HGW-Deltaproteobacteria-7]|jgi:hypothetical protein|nr:MAG: hypothetical protein CVU72_00900 [Deltaproteobacteria bacterium HGW-Deltaproteobacteria-7]PKN20711.1 MAG: hypothetical protein CVU71_02700 [Deltaproteobacteria bacterium HGW-Deltaproteobacteria-6]
MITKWFKLKTSDITLVQFIIEGYEGLATVSTIDPKEAIIQVLIMPDFLEEMEGILDDLKGRFLMEEIPSCRHQVSLC